MGKGRMMIIPWSNNYREALMAGDEEKSEK